MTAAFRKRSHRMALKRPQPHGRRERRQKVELSADRWRLKFGKNPQTVHIGGQSSDCRRSLGRAGRQQQQHERQQHERQQSQQRCQ